MSRPAVSLASKVFTTLYRAQAKEQRCDEVVFISRQTDTPSYDYQMLAREFEARGWKATMHLKKVGSPATPSYVNHVLVEIRLLARCKAVILDRYDPVVGLIDFDREPYLGEYADCSVAHLEYPRVPLVLQLWHAFGSFKKFAFQTIGLSEGFTAEYFDDYRIHDNYSWVVCSGEGSREAFAQAFSYPLDRVVALNRPEYDELVAIREELQMHDYSFDRKRVLMAPTLRKNKLSPHPFRELHTRKDAFERALEANVIWAFHPLEEGLPAPGNVSDELLFCDIVVTDYSSLIYEAHILGKMVAFYLPDIERFRSDPGLNYDPLELAPSLCARDENALQALIDGWLRDPESYPRHELERFTSHAFDANDGKRATQRIVDFMLEHVNR